MGETGRGRYNEGQNATADRLCVFLRGRDFPGI
jgi:hypothetical protein